MKELISRTFEHIVASKSHCAPYRNPGLTVHCAVLCCESVTDVFLLWCSQYPEHNIKTTGYWHAGTAFLLNLISFCLSKCRILIFITETEGNFDGPKCQVVSSPLASIEQEINRLDCFRKQNKKLRISSQ